MVTEVPTAPLDRSEIERILPHRAPFLFLDEVLELVAGARALADWLALGFGFGLAPLATAMFGKDLDLLATGLFGGTAAYLIGRMRRAPA